MLIDKLIAADKNMIESWIKVFGSSSNRGDDEECKIDYIYNEHRAPLNHILRYWNINKQDLFHLLGETMIAERQISFRKSFSQIESDWYNKSGYNSIISEFENTLKNTFVKKRHPKDKEENWGWYSNREYRTLNSLFYTNSLLNNKYNGDTIVIHPFGNENPEGVFKINKGEKVMKILSKLAKLYGLTEMFEQYRLIHSQVLNDAIITGTMCLSIHPMDFMTMSDNDYNWGSCMSWKDNGCYRAGTVEMMNSPIVAIAYLKGKEPMRVPGGNWDNKKWRELIIIDPKAIVNVKSYPYYNEELSTFVVDWARELAMINMGWNFDHDCYDDFPNNNSFTYHDGYDYQFEFWTNTMYNDFNTDNTRHRIYISDFYRHFEDKNETCYMSINYSGELNCMWCGNDMDIDYGSEDTNMVLCEDCQPITICSVCGQPIENKENYFFESNIMCYQCFSKLTVYDELFNETIERENSIKIYLNPDEENFNIKLKNRMYSINTHKKILDKVLNTDMWLSDIFKCDSLHQYEYNNVIYYYVNVNDVTRNGLRNFNIWNNWNIEYYKHSFKDSSFDF